MQQPLKLDQDNCRACGRPIQWVVTSKSGKRIPLDVKMRQVMTVFGVAVRGFESHFATCPHADRFRNGGGVRA